MSRGAARDQGPVPRAAAVARRRRYRGNHGFVALPWSAAEHHAGHYRLREEPGAPGDDQGTPALPPVGTVAIFLPGHVRATGGTESGLTPSRPPAVGAGPASPLAFLWAKPGQALRGRTVH